MFRFDGDAKPAAFLSRRPLAVTLTFSDVGVEGRIVFEHETSSLRSVRGEHDANDRSPHPCASAENICLRTYVIRLRPHVVA